MNLPANEQPTERQIATNKQLGKDEKETVTRFSSIDLHLISILDLINETKKGRKIFFSHTISPNETEPKKYLIFDEKRKTKICRNDVC